MASRRVYTDKDRALVFTELTINEGNIKRTARNLNMPVSTVRYLKQQWEKQGVPESVQEALPAVVSDFVADAERIRDKLLIRLEEYVDSGDIKPREIVPALGMLVDKIRAIRGLDRQIEHRHKVELPNPEEIRELFAGAIEGVLGAAQQRVAEIEDVEFEESAPVALPPTSD
ncbi:MAG TPA: hypothetical protein VIY48_03145 [Candidatus Paceibacterota bacterium]